MKLRQWKRMAACLMAAVMALSAVGCGQSSTANNTTAGSAANTANVSNTSNTQAASTDSSSIAFDNSKWNYDSEHDVYWQVGVPYCTTPQATDYETMGIYVPGAYLTGTKNADGTTYTCTVNESGTFGSYQAKTAPVVLPVNTPGYASSPAPTDFTYDSVADYLAAGFVYLQPGIRGRASMGGNAENQSYSGGAPWGVTDIKAAVRCFRYNASVLPGNPDNIYTFGMSGGGAQSALAGATGDSPLYTPYLEAIGAAMKDASGADLSDAVTGSMCWCPITSLDEADEAYEWNMGQFSTADARAATSFGSLLSEDLAAKYADYINALGLKNGNEVLKLTSSKEGIYQSGSYYDFILATAETSLNNFLQDTTFPYTETATAQFPGGSAGGFGGDGNTTGGMPDLGNMTGGMPENMAGMTGNKPAGMGGGAGAMAPTDGASGTGTTYDTVQDYIDSLNATEKWVTYDAATNTAKISSLAALAKYEKTATKSLGAFDEVDRGQGENNLFGNGQGDSLHFDPVLYQLLKDNAEKYKALENWDDTFVTDFETDLASTDSLGTPVQTRVDMYNPMYFLCDYYKGAGTSTPAKFWRIRTGAFQSDTALTVEANLALALSNNANVKSVDFATVWGMKHVMAERTGDSTTNFIAWVNECAAQ